MIAIANVQYVSLTKVFAAVIMSCTVYAVASLVTNPLMQNPYSNTLSMGLWSMKHNDTFIPEYFKQSCEKSKSKMKSTY